MPVSVFGRRLRWQRERAGLDSRPVAKRLGIARETLNRLENGHQGARPNAHRVTKAAEVFGVPDYYFTTDRVQDVMARLVAEVPLHELSRLPTTGKRLDWAITQLTSLFPPQEFNLDALLKEVGVGAKDLLLYRSDDAIPTPQFLQAFLQATGVPVQFLASGLTAEHPLSYEEVVEEAQRRGVSPHQLKQALDALAVSPSKNPPSPNT